MDRQPTFGDAAVEARRYTVGAAVTLTLSATRGGDRRLTYTLTAPDADGDPATLTFAVDMGAAGAIRPREGTTTYTVTQAPGTLAGIALTVTQPAALDRAVTITVKPSGADVPLAWGRYGFGPAGARAVVLVRYAGQQWEPVAGAADDAAAGQVCAMGVTAFGPLVVEYANAVPTFRDRTVGRRAWRVNEVQAAALPVATGGMIRGTPPAETAARAYTLTATAIPRRWRSGWKWCARRCG